MLDNRLQRRHPLVQIVMDNWIYVVVAIIMWQLPYWLRDHFDQPISNLSARDLRGNQASLWLGVGINLYILAILAMSYNLLFGFSGIISFGHALFFGTAVYVLIILMEIFAQSLMTAIGVTLGVAVLLGLATSLAAFRIKGVYFAMFTLAFAEIFFQLSRVSLFRFLTHGDDGLRFSTEVTPAIALNINRLDMYFLSALSAAFTFLLIRRLMYSPTGRVLVAIRENEERAQTMGFNTVRYKVLVIVLSSVLAAYAGILYAFSAKGADPSTTLGLTQTVDPLIMTIIGGTGTNPGPPIGAAMLHLGETFLRKPDLQVDLNFIVFHYRAEVDTTNDWGLALGTVFILIVLLIPNGVVGQANKLWLEMRHWLRKYLYNPLIRNNPEWADKMEPLTGESPAIARQLAEQTKDASVQDWAIQYPPAAVYSLTLVIASIGGILTWDIQTSISLMLFGWLVSAPFLLGIWIYRHQQELTKQLQDFWANVRFDGR